MNLLFVSNSYKSKDHHEGAPQYAKVLQHELNVNTSIYTSIEYSKSAHQLLKSLSKHGIQTSISERIDYNGIGVIPFLNERLSLHQIQHIKQMDFVLIKTDVPKFVVLRILDICLTFNIPYGILSDNEYYLSEKYRQNASIYLLQHQDETFDELFNIAMTQMKVRFNIEDRVTSPKPQMNPWLKGLLTLILGAVILSVSLFFISIVTNQMLEAQYDHSSTSESIREIEPLSEKNERIELSFEPDEPLECTTVVECAELGDDYLNKLNDHVDMNQEYNLFDFGMFNTKPENERYLYRWKIDSDGQLIDRENINAKKSEDDFKNYQKAYHIFKQITPTHYFDIVDYYGAFTDGPNHYLAFIETRNNEMTLKFDIQDMDHKVQLYRTLVHEIAHVITLNREEFVMLFDCNEEVGTYECLRKDARLQQFFERFWTDYDDRWINNKQKSDKELTAFYNKYSDEFISEYAATNPKEDYAVSFETFVFSKYKNNARIPKDFRINYFYDDEEMVYLRMKLLKNLWTIESES